MKQKKTLGNYIQLDKKSLLIPWPGQKISLYSL